MTKKRFGLSVLGIVVAIGAIVGATKLINAQFGENAQIAATTSASTPAEALARADFSKVNIGAGQEGALSAAFDRSAEPMHKAITLNAGQVTKALKDLDDFKTKYANDQKDINSKIDAVGGRLTTIETQPKFDVEKFEKDLRERMDKRYAPTSSIEQIQSKQQMDRVLVAHQQKWSAFDLIFPRANAQEAPKSAPPAAQKQAETDPLGSEPPLKIAQAAPPKPTTQAAQAAERKASERYKALEANCLAKNFPFVGLSEDEAVKAAGRYSDQDFENYLNECKKLRGATTTTVVAACEPGTEACAESRERPAGKATGPNEKDSCADAPWNCRKPAYTLRLPASAPRCEPYKCDSKTAMPNENGDAICNPRTRC